MELDNPYKKYHLGEYTNTIIDTLALSRTLDQDAAKHGLSAITKRYDVEFDEESHHRGDYDALATALVFHKMMKIRPKNHRCRGKCRHTLQNRSYYPWILSIFT